MGLRKNALELLLPHFPRRRVLSLGYPDLLLSPQEFEQLTGKWIEKRNPAGGKWHFKKWVDIPETVEAFRALGVEEFRAVDVAASRGVETIADLNVPQDLGAWDLVIDPGTTEHCFNVGQALMNGANAVAKGGIILHTPPLTMLNHGFYCMQPTLFHDFYGQNGWEVLTLVATDGFETSEIPSVYRFDAVSNLSLYCLAKRTKLAPLKMPVQSKYLMHPTLS